MYKQIVEPVRTLPVALEADVVVARSGPGGLCAAVAGAPCDVGRQEDGAVQPMTLCFRMRGVHWSLLPHGGDNLVENFGT